MELRDWATRILEEPTVEAKLAPIDVAALTDLGPGPARRIELPARTGRLRFEVPRTHGPEMPRGFTEPRLRAVAHHIMANHELQALEVMAWTLLAFPDAPPEFRLGMVPIMIEEQRHTRMHAERLRALGFEFGDFAVNGHVWIQTRRFAEPLDYLACIPLVFEGSNLDHSAAFAGRFAAAGDPKSAAVMRGIHRDEIGHVAFGWEWLGRLKPPERSAFAVWTEHVHHPIRPEHAKGAPFLEEPRRAAGMDEEFIDAVRRLVRLKPHERPRR